MATSRMHGHGHGHGHGRGSRITDHVHMGWLALWMARLKVPFVGNLKNEIITFYDKLGFKASFALISERKKHFFPTEYQDVKITII